MYPYTMNINAILAQIDSEIARLTQARALLSNSGQVGLPAKSSKTSAAPARKTRKKRVLSADARKRIADAQKKRWAAVRAKKAKSA
jgi:hypothetical protein